MESIKHKQYKQFLKMLFSFISLLMMIAPLINKDASYHTTLFIFLINRLVDLVFLTEEDKSCYIFFNAWAMINIVLGIFSCTLSFTLMVEGLKNILNDTGKWCINIALFLTSGSFVLKELSEMLVIWAKALLIKETIKSKSENIES